MYDASILAIPGRILVLILLLPEFKIHLVPGLQNPPEMIGFEGSLSSTC
jgi:hypothetical protein